MKIPGLVRTIALVVLSFCAICTAAGQQTKQRLITRLPEEQNEPILITNIRVHDRSVAFGEKFDAAEDWLRHLSMSVKNQSDKVILFASIQLQFPEPSPSGKRFRFTI
jgi:ubiquitin C-terminal hydrolase